MEFNSWMNNYIIRIKKKLFKRFWFGESDFNETLITVPNLDPSNFKSGPKSLLHIGYFVSYCNETNCYWWGSVTVPKLDLRNCNTGTKSPQYHRHFSSYCDESWSKCYYGDRIRVSNLDSRNFNTGPWILSN